MNNKENYFESFQQTPHGLKTSYYNPFMVKHRRRTSKMQLRVLEKTFETNVRPDANLRKILGEQLGMTPRSVQVWFQNRRAKIKKRKSDQSPQNTNTLYPVTNLRSQVCLNRSEGHPFSRSLNHFSDGLQNSLKNNLNSFDGLGDTGMDYNMFDCDMDLYTQPNNTDGCYDINPDYFSQKFENDPNFRSSSLKRSGNALYNRQSMPEVRSMNNSICSGQRRNETGLYNSVCNFSNKIHDDNLTANMDGIKSDTRGCFLNPNDFTPRYFDGFDQSAPGEGTMLRYDESYGMSMCELSKVTGSFSSYATQEHPNSNENRLHVSQDKCNMSVSENQKSQLISNEIHATPYTDPFYNIPIDNSHSSWFSQKDEQLNSCFTKSNTRLDIIKTPIYNKNFTIEHSSTNGSMTERHLEVSEKFPPQQNDYLDLNSQINTFSDKTLPNSLHKEGNEQCIRMTEKSGSLDSNYPKGSFTWQKQGVFSTDLNLLSRTKSHDEVKNRRAEDITDASLRNRTTSADIILYPKFCSNHPNYSSDPVHHEKPTDTSHFSVESIDSRHSDPFYRYECPPTSLSNESHYDFDSQDPFNMEMHFFGQEVGTTNMPAELQREIEMSRVTPFKDSNSYRSHPKNRTPCAAINQPHHHSFCHNSARYVPNIRNPYTDYISRPNRENRIHHFYPAAVIPTEVDYRPETHQINSENYYAHHDVPNVKYEIPDNNIPDFTQQLDYPDQSHPSSYYTHDETMDDFYTYQNTVNSNNHYFENESFDSNRIPSHISTPGSISDHVSRQKLFYNKGLGLANQTDSFLTDGPDKDHTSSSYSLEIPIQQVDVGSNNQKSHQKIIDSTVLLDQEFGMDPLTQNLTASLEQQSHMKQDKNFPDGENPVID